MGACTQAVTYSGFIGSAVWEKWNVIHLLPCIRGECYAPGVLEYVIPASEFIFVKEHVYFVKVVFFYL